MRNWLASMHVQMINISKDELSLERKLVEQLEKSHDDFNSGMNKNLTTMKSIGSAIEQIVNF